MKAKEVDITKTLREEILGCDDIETRMVTVKQWSGRKFLVKSFNGEERSQFWELCTDEEGKINSSKLFHMSIIMAVHDPETGKPVFTADDYDILKTKNGMALDSLARVAMKINGLTIDEVEAAEKK